MKNLINTLTSQFNLERLHPKSIKSHPKFFNFLILDIGWQYLAVIGVRILNFYSILWCQGHFELRSLPLNYLLI